MKLSRFSTCPLPASRGNFKAILFTGLRVFAAAILCLGPAMKGQDARRFKTYCNPVDLAYRFELVKPSFREAADPMMLTYKGEYWLFASKSGGYWRSKDLLQWTFVPASGFPLEAWAPTVIVWKEKLYMFVGADKTLYTTSDPGSGRWEAGPQLSRGYGDAAALVDGDRVYVSYGVSGDDVLHIAELDPAEGFREVRTVQVPASRNPADRGWEVPGDHNELLAKAPWIEGSWLDKLEGKYYLQYAGPGTQYKTYGDGVMVSGSPLGPYVYQDYSPFSFKPTGYITSAGHSSTFKANNGELWRISTMDISKKHFFERRVGLFPASLTADGQLMTDTYLEDYPHFIDGRRELTGWMQLSRGKPATASSSLPDHGPVLAVDEDIRTWWSAASGGANEWYQVDLGRSERVDAVQINFADMNSTQHGRSEEVYLYQLLGSTDGKTWTELADHSKTGRDAPHNYEVLSTPRRVRYVRLQNVASPNGANFSLSDLRVFGNAEGSLPGRVTKWKAERDAADGRHASIHWTPEPRAAFYIVRLGTRKDRLTQNYQVYDGTSLEVRSMNRNVRYFLAIDAVNESGIRSGGPGRVLPASRQPR